MPGHTGVEGIEGADELARSMWTKLISQQANDRQMNGYLMELKGLRQSKKLINTTKPAKISDIKKQELRKVVI